MYIYCVVQSKLQIFISPLSGQLSNFDSFSGWDVGSEIILKKLQIDVFLNTFTNRGSL